MSYAGFGFGLSENDRISNLFLFPWLQSKICLDFATAPNGILDQCFRFVEEQGALVPNIYRPSSKLDDVLFFKDALKKVPAISIRDLYVGPRVVASAIKEIYQDLRPRVIPYEMFEEVARIAAIPITTSQVEKIVVIAPTENVELVWSPRSVALQEFVAKLPPANYMALKKLCKHLSKMAQYCRATGMTSAILGSSWSATIFPCANTFHSDEFENICTLTHEMIDQHKSFFPRDPVFNLKKRKWKWN